MQDAWRIELFGKLQASSGQTVLTRFQTRKTGAVLAYLALNRNRAVPREELAELVWPEADPAASRDRLNQSLSSLRRQFESVDPSANLFINELLSVRLNQVATDVEAFEAALASANEARDGDQKIEALEAAIKFYDGPLLPGYFEDWASTERERLAHDYLEALVRLATLLEAKGDIEQAIEYSRMAVAADNLQEENHFRLMRLFSKAGRLSNALKQYRDLEVILRDNLREAPSAATKRLAQLIREKKDSEHGGSELARNILGAERRPVVSRKDVQMPLQLTKFFGREDELETAEQIGIGEGVRLVTLFGAGGCGKTRLAIEIANRLKDRFSGGVWLVPLADLKDAKRIPRAILQTMKLQESGQIAPLEQVIEALQGDSKTLLILDNFEHLSQNGASIVLEILTRVPGVSMLITSRHRLKIGGERELPVKPFNVPDGVCTPDVLLQYSSAQLFVDRARAVRADFCITQRNVEAMCLLCKRLEGIPLAIELAASWSKTYTPAQMLEEINHRFSLLVSRRMDITPRHRTVRAAVEYSYLLLTPELRQFFKQLSIFEGGWTLEGAVHICSEPNALEYLVELTERSLVLTAEDHVESGPAMRFEMLETIRDYAWELLTGDERSALAWRHVQYCLDLVAQVEADLAGGLHTSAMAVMQREYRNILSALRWCQDQSHAPAGLRLAASLSRYWETRGPFDEGRHWLRTFLEMPSDEVSRELRAKALSGLGRIASNQSDYVSSREAYEQSLALQRDLEDSKGISASLCALGVLSYRQMDYEEARRLFEESLRLSTEVGDEQGTARPLLNLGNVALDDDVLPTARQYFERSLAIERSQGNVERCAIVLNNLGHVAEIDHKYQLARFYFEESLSIGEQIGSRVSTGLALFNLGRLCLNEQNYAGAADHLVRASEVYRLSGNKYLYRSCMVDLGRLSNARGDYVRAAKFLSLAEVIREEHNTRVHRESKRDFEVAVALAQSKLDDDTFETAWVSVRSMTPGQRLAMVQELRDPVLF